MRLSDLCDLASLPLDPALTPEALYIGLEHIESGRLQWSARGLAGEVQSAKFSFRKNDVLYGKLRPYLDKAVLANRDGVCSTELLVLRPKRETDPRFLAAALHAPNFVQHAVAGTKGVNHPRTSWVHICEFSFPDFSLADQERIADAVWATHALLVAQTEVIRSTETLKTAAMNELFGHGLGSEAQKETPHGRVPDHWAIMPLEHCATIQTGVTKGRKLDSDDLIEVPYLRVANVQSGFLDLSEIKRIKIRRQELNRYRLQSGDIVLTEGGDLDKLGRGFIWRAEIHDCVHQNHIFAVRVDRSVLDPEYVAYLVQSDYGRSYFLMVGHKTTNLASINSTKLKAFPVLIPPLPEQREIARTLDAIDHKIDLHKRKRDVLDELFRSLLHKLMTGEIRVNDLSISEITQ